MQVAVAPVPVQVDPVLHTRPGQQSWFFAPQAWQLRVVPASPTCAHRKPTSQVPVPAGPVVDGQQGSFAPPQAVQVPGAVVVAPGTQTLLPWQIWPAQQAAPTAPQVEQIRAAPPPGLGQASPGLQTSPGQQALPSVPQSWQVSAPPALVVWQERPDWQSSTVPPLVLQQITADEPQGMQWPVVASHRVPGAVQVAPPVPPVQQTSPLPPQVVPPVTAQAPFVQVPLPPPQVAFSATQVPRTQQPSL